MKAILKRIFQTAAFVPVFALALGLLAPVATVSAADTTCPTDPSQTQDPLSAGANCSKSAGQGQDLFGTNGIFKSITNILLFIIGAISVIMLIIGGIRYVVSGGDQSAVQSAKNTILYAIVGIVVAFLAYAAVNFVLGSLINTTNP